MSIYVTGGAEQEDEMDTLRDKVEELTQYGVNLDNWNDQLQKQLAAMTQERDALVQRIRDYSDTTSGCPDVLVSRELLSKNFPTLYREMECRNALAASQAREAALREALEFYMTPPIGQLNDHHIAAAKLGVAALAAPHDTTALDRSNKLYAAGVLENMAKMAPYVDDHVAMLNNRAEHLRKEAST